MTDWEERALAAEARERAKDEALRTCRDALRDDRLGTPRMEDGDGFYQRLWDAANAADAALAQQPAREGERPAKPYHQPEHNQRNPDPTPDELSDPLFEVIWQTIKGWDVDTDGAGYHGATGNEAAAILRAIRNLRGDQ